MKRYPPIMGSGEFGDQPCRNTATTTNAMAAPNRTMPLAPGLLAADVANGIVLFGAAMALVVVAVFLQGWSPNSPLPMIGGYRFIAQGLSYEIPLAVVLIAAALPARSLAIAPIVTSQEHLWNVVRQPLGLPLYLMAGLGLAFWGPLALPEGQPETGHQVERQAEGLPDDVPEVFL